MRRRSYAADRARWELSAGPGFSPADVPEVAAGYWWDAAAASGLGTAAFKVPEGNGHTTFDLLQATVASQPTLLTENGNQQFRMRKNGDANPSRLATSGSVAMGWAGPTWVAGWFRLPDASGDVTGAGTLLLHFGGAGARRMALAVSITTSDRVTATLSGDGTASSASAWASTFVGGNWVFLACAFLGTDSVTLESNRVAQSAVAGPLAPSSLFNASTQLCVGCRNSGLSNVDTTDWATCIVANGVPSAANQVRLANFRNPLGILLS